MYDNFRGDDYFDALMTLAIALGGDPQGASESVQKANQSRTMLKTELPKDMRPSKEDFEKLGFKFKEIGDPVLYGTELPNGWKISFDGGYWSRIVDSNGFERGNIFYKGALYDRSGYMTLISRYHISTEYAPGQENLSDDDDAEEMIFLEDPSDGSKIKILGQAKRYKSKRSFEKSEQFSRLMKEAEAWIEEKVPNWDDPTKYWD